MREGRASASGETRSPEQIPTEELAAAALKILQQAVGIPREALCRETMLITGYKRFLPTHRPWAEAAVDFLLRQGLIVARNDQLSLPS